MRALKSSKPTLLVVKRTSNSMNFHIHRNILLCLLCIFVGLPVSAPKDCVANQTAQLSDELSDKLLSAKLQNVHVGFGGVYRLGHWTPVQFEVIKNVACDTIEIATIDGDGGEVIYRQPFRRNGATVVETMVRIGRKNAFLKIRLIKEDGEVLTSLDLTAVELNELAKPIASTTGIDLIVGERQIATSVLTKEMTDDGGSVAVYGARDIDWLPTNPSSYDGVSRIIMTTRDDEILESLTPDQLNSIDQWMRNGGSLVASAGKNGDKLFGENGAFAKSTSVRVSGTTELQNTADLEHFATPASQLVTEDDSPLLISRCTAGDGLVVLDANEFPLIVKEAVGFGHITVFGFDIDDPLLKKWDGTARLFLKSQFIDESQTKDEGPDGSTSVSHDGFEDLTGQLRLALDKFSDVQFLDFAMIAVLIAFYILLIGPGDYFLLRKWLGKMHYTWVTFPLITILFCGAAWLIAYSTKPTKFIVNQLDIIDVDLADNRVRASSWAHVYTPESTTVDITIDRTDFPADMGNRSISWQGLPGNGLGGMQNGQSIGRINSTYVQDIRYEGESRRVDIDGVTANVAATRSLFGQWSGKLNTPFRSDLKNDQRRSLAGSLQGTFVNSFDVPLSQCVIFFGEYAYVITETIQPGQAVDLRTEADERTTRGLLTRKTATGEDDTTITPWNTTSTNLDRIGQMLSLYRAAGGKSYTTLTHEFQDYIDLSEQLELNRAILIASIPKTMTELKFNTTDANRDGGTGENIDYELGNQRTILRIVIPVTTLRD